MAEYNQCASEWAPPDPLYHINRPSFPVAALPKWLADFIIALARATQTPPDLGAMLALAAIAATTAGRFAVRIRPGYEEQTNLWTVVALPPGERKTAVQKAITAPFDEWERSAANRLVPIIAQAQTKGKIQQAALQEAESKAARAKPSERASLEADAAQLALDVAGFKVPTVPRFVTDDCTPERLAGLLAENHGRMAVFSDEGGPFEHMAGRYSGTPNLEVYLKGHAGSTLRIDRGHRPPEYIASPALSLGLAVQPSVIFGLAAKEGFRGRGLLGRFLYCLPESRLGRREVDAPPVDQDIADSYRQHFMALLALPACVDENGMPTSYVLELSSGASALFREFELWLEPQLAASGELGSMTDWAGKLAGATARIAGGLHVATHANHTAPWSTPIAESTMRGAVDIGQYCIPHAQAAYLSMGGDPAIGEAKHLLSWIERFGREYFSKRDAWQGTRGHFRKAVALDQPLALLEEYGYISKRAEFTPNRPGRKASPVFDVNPHLWPPNSLNAQNSPTMGESGNTGYSGTCESVPNEPSVIRLEDRRILNEGNDNDSRTICI